MYIDAGPGRSTQKPLYSLPGFYVLKDVHKNRGLRQILMDRTETKKDAEQTV